MPDGTWQQDGKDGWRFWTIPTEGKEFDYWNPVWDHLKGNHRGIVALNAKDIPFVSVDLDRHDGCVSARDHTLRVLNAGRLLKQHFPELYWPMAEVNDKNGSAKLFGFTGKAIPIDTSLDLGRRIHDFLLEHGFGDLEVFPYNCVQVGLPMRSDKTTIVSSGILGKCSRRKKLDGKMVVFEAYSTVAFLDAIRIRSCYDEDTLHHVLKSACAIPPRHAREKSRRGACLGGRGTPHQDGSREGADGAGDYNEEPNALTRQLRALLEMARKLHRVPTEREALAFIKENRLYSGDWADNEARRRGRVRWILKHLAKTFDPAKCGSAKYKIHFGKFDSWASNHVGTLREKVRRYVDEYGVIHEQRGRTTVDWRFVSVMLSIVEFCFGHPNPDQSLPQNGPRKIWESSYEAGLIDMKWDDRKWAIARDWLDEIGVVDVFDRKWHFGNGNGQAMKWRPTDRFHDLHVWYKTKRQASINEPVPLEEFLQGMQPPHPLNYYLDKKALLAALGPDERAMPSTPMTVIGLQDDHEITAERQFEQVLQSRYVPTGMFNKATETAHFYDDDLLAFVAQNA